MGKQNMYDHTVQVPLIFAGPGIPSGQLNDALVYLRDLFPTTCQLAGIKIPASVEARSLVSVIQGQQESVRDRAFCYFKNVQRMIRDDHYKLIHYPAIDRYQLFDNQKDPQEVQDLVASKQHAQVLARLKTELSEWQLRVKDPLVVGLE